MINDALRTSRRRFLTQVGAAGLGIGVPVSIIAAGTQAPWPIREPNGGEFESFWPYLIPGGVKFPEGPTIPGPTGADAATIPISCAGIEVRPTKNGPRGSGPSLDNRTV